MSDPKQDQPAPAAEDPEIPLGTLPLSAVNFIINTLNANPLGGQVMQVANLIGALKQRAQDFLTKPDPRVIPEIPGDLPTAMRAVKGGTRAKK